MNQNNNNDKEKMLEMIKMVNKVEGFDPAPFALDLTDEQTGEVRKHLPVRTQLAWFWMKYPNGKIDVQVEPDNESFVAHARIYPDYTAQEHCYIASGTASKSLSEEKPNISPREWAQTAAIGVALRNAGFGLQFEMVGTMPDGMTQTDAGSYQQQAGYTSLQAVPMQHNQQMQASQNQMTQYRAYNPTLQMQPELTAEQKMQQAMNMPCPVTKFAGKTLGEVLVIDPGAIKWIATKFSGDEEISAAAKFLCEYSLQATA